MDITYQPVYKSVVGFFDPIETPHIAFYDGFLYFQIKDQIIVIKNEQHIRSFVIEGLKRVGSIFIDKFGALYATRKTKIQRIYLEEGKLETIAGSDQVGFRDGLFLDAQFSSLGIMCHDGNHNVFVVDSSYIRKLNFVDCTVTTVSRKLIFPYGIGLMKTGDIIASEWGFVSIIKWGEPYCKELLAGSNTDLSFKDGVCNEARFNRAAGLVVDGNHVIICDKLNSKIRKLNLDTKQVTTVATMTRPDFIISASNCLFVVSQLALQKFVKGIL